MTIGGRPPEEGGHKAVKFSLNKKSHEILAKVQSTGQTMSKFVEDALLIATDPRIRSLHRIMQQHPLKHTYLDDPRISCTIESTGVNYRLKVVDSVNILARFQPS